MSSMTVNDINHIRNGFVSENIQKGNYWIAVAGWEVAARRLVDAQNDAQHAHTTEKVYTAVAIIFAAIGVVAAAAVTAAYFNVSYGIAACALVGGPFNLAIGAVASLVLAFAFGSVGESAGHSAQQKEQILQKRAETVAAAKAYIEDAKDHPDSKDSRLAELSRLTSQLFVVVKGFLASYDQR